MGPFSILICVVCSIVGAGMGLFSGLVPGIHVNTLASVMLASYPAMEELLSGIVGEGRAAAAVSCCIMSAAVVHSFVDFVPSVFIGAPDSDDHVAMLPGHRLLLQGRGMAAVRAAAVGSLVGASAAVTLAVPLQWVMMAGCEGFLDGLTPVVVTAAASRGRCCSASRGRWVWRSWTWVYPRTGFLVMGRCCSPCCPDCSGCPCS